MKLTREEELLRYRTYIWSSGIRLPTCDWHRYYVEMPTKEMIQHRDKTQRDLERNPDFAYKFYSEHLEYLNNQLAKRRNLRDWLWRNTVLKIDLFVWTMIIRIKKKYFGVK